MGKIQVLDQQTIDKIAAGEVIERPASVVKELVENAMDAGATAVTVEIRDGGIGFMRITDNGSGIEEEEVPTAFLRHSTSKIRKVEDLFGISSLGFRGEALSSISAVSMVELITKPAAQMAGCKYIIEGGKEKGLEPTAAPDGTTFLIKNLFYNTPARRKFLKSATTEASYVGDLMEHLALSRPDISFRFLQNGQTKLHTAGNNNLKDIIYQIYGKDFANNLIPIDARTEGVHVTGFIGKPIIGRGNRNFETYFVNGRYVKSNIIAKAIEEAYRTFLMQHKYPFVVLHFDVDGDLLDVNVHPTKMELRFSNQMQMYQFVTDTVRDALLGKNLIANVTLTEEDEKPAKTNDAEKIRELAGNKPQGGRFAQQNSFAPQGSGYTPKENSSAPGRDIRKESGERIERKIAEPENPYVSAKQPAATVQPVSTKEPAPISRQVPPPQTPQDANLAYFMAEMRKRVEKAHENQQIPQGKPEQLELFTQDLLDPKKKNDIRIIGQLFDTYWLVQLEETFYMIDQHAAHEKVNFERLMAKYRKKEIISQLVSPPTIFTANLQEAEILERFADQFRELGFEIEPFGGKEYAIRAVPDNLYGIASKDLFVEMLDSMTEDVSIGRADAQLIPEKIATMSCKAAIKGNQKVSLMEAQQLIEELFTLENPYTCPHGRPTIISMTKQEIEKKFKRIV